MREFWFVCHVFDHDVFVKDTIICGFYIFINGGHEFFERKSFSYWHDLISEFLIWCMEGNGKLDIDFVFDEFLDSWDDTTGGDCDMSSS